MSMQTVINNIEASLAAGRIGPAEARALLAEVNAAQAAPPPAYTPPAPTDFADTGLSETQLAVASLMRLGVSELDAHRQVSTEGLAAHEEGIKSEAIRIRGAKAAERAAELANTPEGRAAAAEAIIAKREADARKLELATALLSEHLSAEDIATLDTETIIRESGIDGVTDTFNDGANDMAANLKAAEQSGGLNLG